MIPLGGGRWAKALVLPAGTSEYCVAVDDDVQIRTSLGRALRAEGDEVILADDVIPFRCELGLDDVSVRGGSVFDLPFTVDQDAVLRPGAVDPVVISGLGCWETRPLPAILFCYYVALPGRLEHAMGRI